MIWCLLISQSLRQYDSDQWSIWDDIIYNHKMQLKYNLIFSCHILIIVVIIDWYLFNEKWKNIKFLITAGF